MLSGQSKYAMSWARWIACLLLAGFLWPASSFGQSAELVEVQKQFDAQYAKGQYRAALSTAELLLELGEMELGENHPFMATLLEKTASANEANMRYDEAQRLYDRAQAIRNRALESDDTIAEDNKLARQPAYSHADIPGKLILFDEDEEERLVVIVPSEWNLAKEREIDSDDYIDSRGVLNWVEYARRPLKRC